MADSRRAEKRCISYTPEHWCIRARSAIDKSSVGQLMTMRERFDVDNCGLQL